MLGRVRKQFLVLAVLIGLASVLAPSMVLSRDAADRDVRVFHRTIGLTQNDLRDADAVGAAMSQFTGTVYGPSAAHVSPRIPLSQFTSSVSAQARRENWVSLVLDVWVGGDRLPAGYYFRYQGRRAAGELVRGESFLASPDEVEKYLARPSGFIRQMTDAYEDLVGTPERLFDPVGK